MGCGDVEWATRSFLFCFFGGPHTPEHDGKRTRNFLVHCAWRVRDVCRSVLYYCSAAKGLTLRWEKRADVLGSITSPVRERCTRWT